MSTYTKLVEKLGRKPWFLTGPKGERVYTDGRNSVTLTHDLTMRTKHKIKLLRVLIALQELGR